MVPFVALALFVIRHREEPLTALLDVYEEKGYAVDRITIDGTLPPPPALEAAAAESDALLVIGPRQRAARTALSGPVVWRSDGRAIPAGWLPDLGPVAVRRFSETAALLHRRTGNLQPIAVLSQWMPRYLKLAERIEQILERQKEFVFRWSSDLLLREDMVRGLRSGLAAAIYIGHGRPTGWVGYRGTRLRHLVDQPGEPLGAVVSLCCQTASRRRTGLSFSEAIPLHGVAGAAFGSVTNTLHFNNTRWAVGLCTALNDGVTSLGEWIVKALPPNEQCVTDYRLLGDPLAPLVGTPEGIARAQAIEVYP